MRRIPARNDSGNQKVAIAKPQLTIDLSQRYRPRKELPLGKLLDQALRVMWGKIPETFTWHREFLAERALRAVCDAIISQGEPEMPLKVLLLRGGEYEVTVIEKLRNGPAKQFSL